MFGDTAPGHILAPWTTPPFLEYLKVKSAQVFGNRFYSDSYRALAARNPVSRHALRYKNPAAVSVACRPSDGI